QLLNSYLDGELAADERQRLEQHVLSCPACAAELNQLRASGRVLAEYQFDDLTDDELSDLHAAVDKAADRPIWRIGGTSGIVPRSRTEILLIGLTILALSAGVVAGMLVSRLPTPGSAVETPDRSPLEQELGLTPDQRDKMKDIWEKVRGDVSQSFRDAQQLSKD